MTHNLVRMGALGRLLCAPLGTRMLDDEPKISRIYCATVLVNGGREWMERFAPYAAGF
jgi:hypothetical protein